jgi:RNA polymerase sigma-70 factor, ECF subfamily
MSDDREVIQRIVNGDRAAFRLLVERYERRLFGFLRRFLPSAADCEDIAQDVFLSVYRNLASYRPESAQFSTWLLTIARNKCLNALSRRRVAERGATERSSAAEPVDPRTPEAALTEAEFFRRLDAALATLPLEQKTAFVLAELQGLSLEDISRIERVSLGTVKSRLGRARLKLRGCFERAELT